jgi:hypothetical protein
MKAAKRHHLTVNEFSSRKGTAVLQDHRQVKEEVHK